MARSPRLLLVVVLIWLVAAPAPVVAAPLQLQPRKHESIELIRHSYAHEHENGI